MPSKAKNNDEDIEIVDGADPIMENAPELTDGPVDPVTPPADEPPVDNGDVPPTDEPVTPPVDGDNKDPKDPVTPPTPKTEPAKTVNATVDSTKYTFKIGSSSDASATAVSRSLTVTEAVKHYLKNPLGYIAVDNIDELDEICAKVGKTEVKVPNAEGKYVPLAKEAKARLIKRITEFSKARVR